jgi:predicted acyltransferase
MRARNRNAQSMNNTSSRNVALDLMRGLTIALMIIVNNPGDWKNMFSLLEHADWNGFLGADIVFPFFLFVAGFAAALKIERVYGEIRAAGPHCASALTLGDGLRSSKPYIFPLLRRTAILFLIGLFLNGWPFGLLPGTEFSPQNLRLFGVMQRIAISVMLGGLILRYAQSRTALVTCMVLMALLYEGLMRIPLVEYAGVTFGQTFELQANFARYVDIQIVPNSMLYKVHKIPFDPEGLLTSLTATLTFLVGGLTFRLKSTERIGLALTFCVAGIAMQSVEPINKHLWTVPYVLLTGAGAILMLMALEKLRLGQSGIAKKFSAPFVAMGLNPLLIYALSSIAAKTLAYWKISPQQSLKQLCYTGLAALPVSPKSASLIYSISLLTVFTLVALLLRGKRLVAR